MFWIGPHGLDLRSKTRNRRYRGRCGVGIERLRWCQERRGWQVYRKVGRVNVVSYWGPYWVESLWSCCTNDEGINVIYKVFSWGTSIHCPGNPGRQWEVVLPWPHILEGWNCRMRSWKLPCWRMCLSLASLSMRRIPLIMLYQWWGNQRNL